MNSFLLSLGFIAAAEPSPLPPLTQKFDTLCEQRGWCGPAANQPFAMLPRVCPVEPCPCEDAKGDANCPPAKYLTWEFHHAAQVMLPRFDPLGQQLDADGLLIYEGMRFRAFPTSGTYELAFTATVPEMPVTLRLQLLFKNEANGQVMRLTMPPIRMEPKKDARPGDPSANTFHISHRGYSSLFKGPVVGDQPPANPWPVIDSTWKLDRVGTARFGTPVAIDDPTR